MKLVLPNSKVSQMKSSLFVVGLLFLVIVVIWVIFSVSQAFSQRKENPQIDALLKPLDPILDTEVLTNYQQTRQTPPPEFKIKITSKTKENNQPQSSLLDPFTSQSEPVSTSAATQVDLSLQPGE